MNFQCPHWKLKHILLIVGNAHGFDKINKYEWQKKKCTKISTSKVNNLATVGALGETEKQ